MLNRSQKTVKRSHQLTNKEIRAERSEPDSYRPPRRGEQSESISKECQSPKDHESSIMITHQAVKTGNDITDALRIGSGMDFSGIPLPQHSFV